MVRRLWQRRTGFAWLAALLLAACGGAQVQSGSGTSSDSALDAYPLSPSGTPPGASPEARARASELARGINFGNMLEPPREGDWGLRVEDEFIQLVGQGGFTRSVRLPVRWSNHASADAAAIIDPTFFARVDSVVDRLLARGVTLVLNMHHYRQLDGDTLDPQETAVDPALVRLRFLAMWQQIAKRYADRGSRLVFEIYNEPHGALEPHWNDLLSRALRIIRQSNPTRVVMIGPTLWNSASRLAQLRLPPDANLILTVHNYEPFDFTHQGAEWVQPLKPTGLDCCTAAMQKQMTDPLELAAQEARRMGYPVVVGEFGAYSKAPQEARLRYLRFMRQQMDARELPWIYWELAAGFGIYDPQAKRMRADMVDALYGLR